MCIRDSLSIFILDNFVNEYFELPIIRGDRAPTKSILKKNCSNSCLLHYRRCGAGVDLGDAGGQLRADAWIKFYGNRRDSEVGGSDGDGSSRSDSSVSRSPGHLSAPSSAADSIQSLPVSDRSTRGSIRALWNSTMLPTPPNMAPSTRLQCW